MASLEFVGVLMLLAGSSGLLALSRERRLRRRLRWLSAFIELNEDPGP